MIISVYVNKDGGAPYVSRLERTRRGSVWRCGKCRRGNLGMFPKRGESCRVCKSRVMAIEEAP